MENYEKTEQEPNLSSGPNLLEHGGNVNLGKKYLPRNIKKRRN